MRRAMLNSEPSSPGAANADFSHAGSSHRPHLIWAVLIALALRLIVVGFLYQGFLDPGRDHWEFGYELGKVAYSITSGHGFGNPYWVQTGPTAMITPIYPYLMSVVFWMFGAYTKSAALAVLGFNCLVSALTCIPVFFLARNSFGLRTAIGALWAWVFFPYAIYFSAGSMWYHSFVALLLTLLLLIASYLESRTQLWMWAGFGALWGFTALTTPVVLAVVPFLGGWVCYRLHGNKKNWTVPAATAAFALLATIAPWMIRNYQVFDRPVFLKDNFWMEVCVGNLGNAQHWWNDAVHPAGNNAELVEFRQLGELGYMAKKHQQALALIHDEPGIFVALCTCGPGFGALARTTSTKSRWTLPTRFSARYSPLWRCSVYTKHSALRGMLSCPMPSLCSPSRWSTTSLMRRFPIACPWNHNLLFSPHSP
jgi:hypothetical protein